MDYQGRRQLRLTHQGSSVERVGSNSDNDVLSYTLQYFPSRDHKATETCQNRMNPPFVWKPTDTKHSLILETLASFFFPFSLSQALFIGGLVDRIGFTSSSRFIAFDRVASKENAINLNEKDTKSKYLTASTSTMRPTTYGDDLSRF